MMIIKTAALISGPSVEKKTTQIEAIVIKNMKASSLVINLIYSVIQDLPRIA